MPLTILRLHGFESFEKRRQEGQMERKWVDNLVFAHGERETRQNKETEKQARIVHFKGELGLRCVMPVN